MQSVHCAQHTAWVDDKKAAARERWGRPSALLHIVPLIIIITIIIVIITAIIIIVIIIVVAKMIILDFDRHCPHVAFKSLSAMIVDIKSVNFLMIIFNIISYVKRCCCWPPSQRQLYVNLCGSIIADASSPPLPDQGMFGQQPLSAFPALSPTLCQLSHDSPPVAKLAMPAIWEGGNTSSTSPSHPIHVRRVIVSLSL